MLEFHLSNPWFDFYQFVELYLRDPSRKLSRIILFDFFLEILIPCIKKLFQFLSDDIPDNYLTKKQEFRYQVNCDCLIHEFSAFVFPGSHHNPQFHSSASECSSSSWLYRKSHHHQGYLGLSGTFVAIIFSDGCLLLGMFILVLRIWILVCICLQFILNWVRKGIVNDGLRDRP